jgi:tetratricopeptide (TPR) repeat protein
LLLTLLVFTSTRTAADPGPWCRLTAADFHLLSDLGEVEQRNLLQRLRWLQPVAEPYLPGRPKASLAPLKIIVFSRRSDFRRMTGKRKFAGFMQPSLRTDRLLVGPIRGDLTETLQHEYVHYLLRNRLDVSLPMWFDEGLASILGTVEMDKEALVGELPTERMRGRLDPSADQDPARTMLAKTLSATEVASWPQHRIDGFYDWSWLLTHYLTLGPEAEQADLPAYLGTRSQSLTEHLGVSEATLLRGLGRYLRGPLEVRRVPLPEADPSASSFECLGTYERDLELARAILIQNPKMARTLLSAHLSDHPDDVGLLVTRARIEQAADRLDAARVLAVRAEALAPASANVTILQADLTVHGCLLPLDENCPRRWQQAAPRYRAALKRDADRLDAVLSLGIAYLYSGRPGEAVNYFRVAYGRMPWAAVANYYLGESYRQIGDTRAFGYLSNARNWASLPVWRMLAEESLRLLEAGDAGALQPASADHTTGSDSG